MAGGGAEYESTLSGPQRQIARQIASSLSGRIGAGATPFDGELVAPLLEDFNAIRSRVAAFDPSLLGDEQQSALQRLLGGQPAARIDPQRTQDVFQQQMVAPAMRMFDQEIAPRIAGDFAGLGQTFSSRRAGAEARTLGNLQQGLMGNLSSMLREDEQLRAGLADSAAQRQLAAVPQAQQFAVSPLQQALAQMQALSPFQQRQDMGQQAQLQEFLRLAPENDPFTRLGLQFTGQQQGTLVEGQGPLGGFGGILGSLGGMAAGFGMMGMGPLGGLLGGGR